MKKRIFCFCLIVGLLILPTGLNNNNKQNHHTEDRLPEITKEYNIV